MGKKVLTFSYDDGVTQHIRLVALWDRFGMRGTVNLNSGLLGSDEVFMYKGVKVRRLDAVTAKTLYQGQEGACHSRCHPHLELLDAEACRSELANDKAALEALAGAPVVGMAYPYGT